MDEKELQALYNAMSSKFEVGDYNAFKSKMQTPEQRKSFYDAVGKNGFDLGDYNEYEQRVGGTKKKELPGVLSLGAKLLSSTSKPSQNGTKPIAQSPLPSVSEVKEPEENDPIKTYLTPLRLRRNEIVNRGLQTESTGQNKILKQQMSDEVNNINDTEFVIKQELFPTTHKAEAFLMRNPNAEKNETSAIAKKIVDDSKAVKQALYNGNNDIHRAAINYYASQDNKVGKQLRTMIEGSAEIPKLMEADLVQGYLNTRAMKEMKREDKGMHNIIAAQELNYYRDYPEKRSQMILSKISQGREDLGHNNWFLNLPGIKSSDSVVDYLEAEGQLSSDDKEHYEKFVRPLIKLGAAEIPTPGVAENAVKGAAEGVANLPKTVYEATGLRDLLHSNGEILSDNLQEDLEKTPQPKYKGLLHNVSNATGSLLGVIAPITAEAKILKGANLIKNAAVANQVATGLTFYHDIQKAESERNPDNPMLAHLSALIQSAVWAKGGQVFGKLGEDVIKSSAPEINTVLKSLQEGTINNATAAKTITETVIPKIFDVAGNSVKESSKIAGITMLNKTVSDVLNGEFNLKENINEGVNTFEQMMLSLPLLEIAKVSGSKNMTADYLDEIANNPQRYEGNFDSPEVKKNFEFLLEVNKELKNRTLDDSQRKQYQLLALKQKILEDKISQSPADKQLRKEDERKVAELEIEKDKTLNPDKSNTAVVQEFYDNDLLSKGDMGTLEVEGKFSESKVGEYLKQVAQQANNLNEKWQPIEGKFKMGKPAGIPEQIIELANERWKKEIEAAQPKAQPLDQVREVDNGMTPPEETPPTPKGNTSNAEGREQSISPTKKIIVTNYDSQNGANDVHDFLSGMGANVKKERSETNSFYIKGEIGDYDIDVRISDHTKPFDKNVIGNVEKPKDYVRISRGKYGNTIEADITNAQTLNELKEKIKSDIGQSLSTPKGNTSNVEAGSVGVGGDVERAAKEYVQPDIEDRSIRNSAIESDVNRGRKEILNPEKDKSWDKNHYQYNLELLGSLIAERDSFENIKKENADRDFTEMQGIPPKDENGKFIKNGEEYNEYIDRAILPNLNKNIDNFKEYISEAYQKSKKDGTNPELVKAVEQSLKETTKAETTTTNTGVVEGSVGVGGDVGRTAKAVSKRVAVEHAGYEGAKRVTGANENTLELDGYGTVSTSQFINTLVENGRLPKEALKNRHIQLTDEYATKLLNENSDLFPKENTETNKTESNLPTFESAKNEYDAVKEKYSKHLKKDGGLRANTPDNVKKEIEDAYTKMRSTVKQERDKRVSDDKRDTGLIDGIERIKDNTSAFTLVRMAMNRGVIPERQYNEFGKNLLHIIADAKDSHEVTMQTAEIIQDFSQRANVKVDDALAREIQAAENLKYEPVEQSLKETPQAGDVGVGVVGVDIPKSQLKSIKNQLKEKYDNALVAFSKDGFIQFIEEDAQEVSKILKSILTKSNDYDVTGFSGDDAESNFKKILKNGNRIALYEVAEQSLKETTKAETTTTNTGVEEGSGGVGGDVMPKEVSDLYSEAASLRFTLNALKQQMRGRELVGKSKAEYESTKTRLDNIELKLSEYEKSKSQGKPKAEEVKKEKAVETKQTFEAGDEANYYDDLFDKTDKVKILYKTGDGENGTERYQVKFENGQEASIWSDKLQSLSKQESGGKAPVTKSEGELSIEDARVIVEENKRLWDERNKDLETISEKFISGKIDNKEYISEVKKLDEQFAKENPDYYKFKDGNISNSDNVNNAVRNLYEKGSKKLIEDLTKGLEEKFSVKIPTEKVKNETKQEPTKDIKPEQADKVKELEAERDMAILREGKPEVKMEFVTAKELVDSKDPIGNKKIHTDIKDRYKKMRELLDCLWA